MKLDEIAEAAQRISLRRDNQRINDLADMIMYLALALAQQHTELVRLRQEQRT